MAHVRSTIVDRIATAIALSGVTVRKSRVYPTDSAELPMFLVYGRDEDMGWTGAVGRIDRMLSVVVEVVAEDTDLAVETTLNNYAQHIEDALNAPGAIADALWTRSTNMSISLDHSGNKPVGNMELTFEVFYRTLTADATTFA